MLWKYRWNLRRYPENKTWVWKLFAWANQKYCSFLSNFIVKIPNVWEMSHFLGLLRKLKLLLIFYRKCFTSQITKYLLNSVYKSLNWLTMAIKATLWLHKRSFGKVFYSSFGIHNGLMRPLSVPEICVKWPQSIDPWFLLLQYNHRGGLSLLSGCWVSAFSLSLAASASASEETLGGWERLTIDPNASTASPTPARLSSFFLAPFAYFQGCTSYIKFLDLRGPSGLHRLFTAYQMWSKYPTSFLKFQNKTDLIGLKM